MNPRGFINWSPSVRDVEPLPESISGQTDFIIALDRPVKLYLVALSTHSESFVFVSRRFPFN